jgi:AcrR family transcriptional regulator
MKRIIKKPIERKKDILDASLKLFMENGYHKTTTYNIIELLDIGKGTFYHYFKSKEDVLDAIIDRFIEEVIFETETIIGRKDLNAVQKLEMTAFKELEINFKHLPYLHKLKNIDIHSRVISKMIDNYTPVYFKIIQEGIDQNMFSSEYPYETIQFSIISSHFLFDPGLFKWSKEELYKKIKFLIKITEYSLEAPKGSFDFYFKVFGSIFNYQF